MKRMMMIATIVGTAMSAPAFASVTITQGATAPTYGITLNFDAPGDPTGIISPDAYLPGYGITELQAGDGQPVVDDFTAVYPWVGSGNSFYGNFGVFITFDSDLSEFSADIWDPSGPPSPFGGGFAVYAFDNGVEVANYFGEPAWGGLGDPAIDITTTGGMVFDEVRVLGYGFNPTTYADNLSWNAVPEPMTIVFLGLGAVAALRRRR